MSRFLFVLLLAGWAGPALGQTYADSLQTWRMNYRKAFLTEERSPLKRSDLRFLRFFEADPSWVVWARFEAVTDTSGFDMETRTGVKKRYLVYGRVEFEREGRTHRLFLYRSRKLMETPGHEDHLFLPFYDETNYQATYGGGRYIDLKTGDLVNGRIRIDFNQAYNPYCAYKGGYACPIPPAENRLELPVRAGERNFGRPEQHEP